QVVQVDVGGVLGGHHHGVQAHRLLAVVFDGDLGLAVRAQVRQHLLLAHGGEPAGQAVGHGDRHRHQLGGVGAGVAEHQPLVAGALPVDRVVGAVHPRLVGAVDALRDLRGLCADGDVDPAGVDVEALGRRVVADLQDLVAHDLGDVDVGGGGDLADH